MFTIRAGYDLESAEMIRFLHNEKGIQEFAVFYQDDSYGQNGMMSTQQKIDELHLKRIAKGGYDRKTNDISAALREIKVARPRAVILWGTPKQSGTFVREAYREGLRPIYVAACAALSNEFVAAMESTPVEVYFTDCVPFYASKGLPIYQEYVKESKAAGLKESGTGFEGYLNALVLIEGIRRAGKDITRENFHGAMESLKNFDLGGVTISFSPGDHQGLEAATLVRLKDGVFQSVK